MWNEDPHKVATSQLMSARETSESAMDQYTLCRFVSTFQAYEDEIQSTEKKSTGCLVHGEKWNKNITFSKYNFWPQQIKNTNEAKRR